ncbi:hypothetical protein ACIRF8_25750 [Streptomyces sp. NPDC102406]|uniref:hypothetical protein n=1 Tax=Streptomyces sp. NPDC102406 TaxID=3366171 RepID=UPI00382E62EC
MKACKAAAVVAGSLAITGAAAPAFASDLTPTSLNGAVNTITSQRTLDVNPVDTNLLDPKNEHGLLGAVSDAVHGMDSKADSTNNSGNLLGGLPLGR